MRIIEVSKDSIKNLEVTIKNTNFFPSEIEDNVRKIIENVRIRGDEALLQYTDKFDHTRIDSKDIKINNSELESIGSGVDEDFVNALKIASRRVRDFHEKAIPFDWSYFDSFGNLLGQRFKPLERVGIYIPGGKASYPSSIIMTAVVAKAAGVKEIAVISPPSSFNTPSPVAAAINVIGGIDDVYRVGGVQGVAALAFGTETVKRVDKIVGPGNIYVTVAKKMLYGYVDIDMVAGPSEVLVIADESSDIDFVALDLIAQAEHDEDARPMCITMDRDTAEKISKRVYERLEENPRKGIARKAVEKNGVIYIVGSYEEAAELANTIAPEHLEIQTKNPRYLAGKIKNAGAVFIGKYSAEAFGDYISGPSHVLPTGGTARFFSPLNVLSFIKVTSVIEMTSEGSSSVGRYAERIAEVEGLYGHKKSLEVRRVKKENQQE